MADTTGLSDEHLAARLIGRIVAAVEQARNDDLFDIVLRALRSARLEGRREMQERAAAFLDKGARSLESLAYNFVSENSKERCNALAQQFFGAANDIRALDPELPETPKL